MRIVMDTNLLVSAVISAGLPRLLLSGAKTGAFELCISETLLAELLDVLTRDKFLSRLAQAGLTPAGIVADIRKLAVLVTPVMVPPVVPTDPDDDHVLAAALTGNVNLIASGDKRDLLPLQNYQGIDIVSARVALARIGMNEKK